MSVLKDYYRGSSWIKNLLRAQKQKGLQNLKQPLLAGGCFLVDQIYFGGAAGHWTRVRLVTRLFVYKLSSSYDFTKEPTWKRTEKIGSFALKNLMITIAASQQ